MLFEYISTFSVHEPNILSDHCLIDFSLTFNANSRTDINCSNKTDHTCSYVWKCEHKDTYNELLSSEAFTGKLNAWVNDLNTCSTANDIDACMFRNDKTDENKRNFIDARTQFKKCLRKSKLDHDRGQTKKLLEAKFKNAKLYWKLLKQSTVSDKSNITIDAFKQYFQSINNPDSTFFTPDEDVIHFLERYENDEFKIMFEELNVPISTHEINKALQHTSSGKSA